MDLAAYLCDLRSGVLGGRDGLLSLLSAERQTTEQASSNS